MSDRAERVAKRYEKLAEDHEDKARICRNNAQFSEEEYHKPQARGLRMDAERARKAAP